MSYAPIAFFAYSRAEYALPVLASLAKNQGAAESKLYIFCDGARNDAAAADVRELRQAVRREKWCGEVEIIEREKNFGCAKNIVDGITRVCAERGRVIVLEEDLVVSPWFLDYMNRGLNAYESESAIMQIAGYTFPATYPAVDTFFLPVPTCWGWATWQRAWDCMANVDTDEIFRRLTDAPELRRQFDMDGTYPYYNMLENVRAGALNSWAVEWYLRVFQQAGLTLYPRQSLVSNIGVHGLHFDNVDEFTIEVGQEKVGEFPSAVTQNEEAYRQHCAYFRQRVRRAYLPLWRRLARRLRTAIGM